MPRSRRLLTAVVFMCTASVIASCSNSGGGGGATTAAAQRGSASQSKRVLPLTVGLGVPEPTLSLYDYWFADQEGFFPKNNVAPKAQYYSSDITSIRALESGTVQLSSEGPSAAFSAIAAGAKIKIIGAIIWKTAYNLVTVDSVTRPRELEGKTVAVSAPGAISAEIPELLISADGGDLHKVKFAPIGGNSDRVNALIAGRVDASLAANYLVPTVMAHKGFHSISNTTTSLPKYMGAVYTATESSLANPDTRAAIVNYMAAVMQGVRWAVNNESAAVDDVFKLIPSVPKSVLSTSLKEMDANHYWNLNGDVPKDSFNFTAQASKQLGDVKAVPSYDSEVDGSVVADAIKLIGSASYPTK